MQKKIKIAKVNEQPVKHIAANVYKQNKLTVAVEKYLVKAMRLN